jgi:hypothetical protein
MPVRVVFRCQFCDARPDQATQRTMEGQLREASFGQYLDAPPGRWLVWQGRGPLGPIRYACQAHRGDLVAYLREHYGTVAPNPWKRPPYPVSLRNDDSERAFRRLQSGGTAAW